VKGKNLKIKIQLVCANSDQLGSIVVNFTHDMVVILRLKICLTKERAENRLNYVPGERTKG